jgi:hypothetical protein
MRAMVRVEDTQEIPKSEGGVNSIAIKVIYSGQA